MGEQQGEQLDRIITERGKQYGEPTFNHRNIGLAWTGLIQQHYGIDRACNDAPYHEDNYLDGINYVRLAQRAAESEQRQ